MFKGLAGKLFGSASAPEAFSKDTLRPLIRRRAEWLLEATGPRPGSWEPAIMLPDRNHLMFANANDQQAVHAMVEAAEAIYEKSDGPLSMQPLVRRNNDLVPLALTGSAHDTVRRQVLNALVLAHEAQQRERSAAQRPRRAPDGGRELIRGGLGTGVGENLHRSAIVRDRPVQAALR